MFKLDVDRLTYTRDMTPRHCLGLLSAMLDHWYAQWRPPSDGERLASPLEGPYGRAAADLNKIAERDSLMAWRQLLPRLKRGVRLANKQRGHVLVSHELRRANLSLRRLMAIAGRDLVTAAPTRLAHMLATLRRPQSRALDVLAADVLEHAPGEHADVGVDWLARRPERLSVGWPRRSTSPRPFRGERLVRHLAGHCSGEAFERLERAVLAVHPPQEKRTLRVRVEQIRARNPRIPPNLYGWAQYRLLCAMPGSR